MNYLCTPQSKINEPIYNIKTKCPNCKSTKSYPLLNIYGSTRECYECKTIFKPDIVGFR